MATRKSKSRATEWRHRKAAQLAAQRTGGGLPVRVTPNTMVTVQEKADYREARRRHLDQFPDYDAGWERPTPKTARAVWALLESHLSIRLADIHPDQLTAQQLLVVALDAGVTAGRYGQRQDFRPEASDASLRRVRRTLTRTKFFDAVARRWSDRYREAREHGQAFSVSQMTEDTAKRCWRDLLVNEVALPALWKAVTEANPLFSVRDSKRLDGYRVVLRHGPVLKTFERLVRRDPVYSKTRVQNVWWLWIDGEPQPPTEAHVPICAERPYNEVPVGALSDEILKIQEGTRLLFDAPAFVADYQRIRATREKIKLAMAAWSGHPITMKLPWKLLDEQQRLLKKRALKMRAFLLEFRSVYEQAVRLKQVVTVRSAFYKVLNRRFQNAHFFPMAVSNREDRLLPEALQFDEPGLSPVPDFWTMPDASRSRWFSVQGPSAPLPMVAVDVSSSQTQVTAALLGLPKPELKKRRAARAWKERKWLLREETGGYTGPTDKRLVEAVKNLLMRLGYGSAVHRVVRDQSWDTDLYGPGWTSAKAVTSFLQHLPGFVESDRFLKACRWIGLNADEYAGLALVDPLDQTPFAWNPVQRADVRLALDKWDLTLVLPGRYPGGVCPKCKASRSSRRGERRTCSNTECGHTWTVRFIPGVQDAKGRYPVSQRKLRNLTAPCLIHMLDALFAAHVIRELHRRGVANIVSIHDGWYIPQTPDADKVLQQALRAAGEPWLRALEDVYKLLEAYLKPSPDPEWWDMLVEAGRGWKRRVKLKKWPVFSASVS